MDAAWRTPGAIVPLATPGWRPTGLADGVLFLQAETVSVQRGNEIITTVVTPGTEDQALRYLRPPAESWYLRHPNPLCGGAATVLTFVLQAVQPSGLFAAHQAAGRAIGHAICADHPRLLKLNTAEVLSSIHAEPVEEGIWILSF